MTKTVYAFAGPEGGGKTTAAKMVKDAHLDGDAIVIGFAEPIKHMMLALGVPYKNLYGTQAEKEEPLDVLCGRSARYAMQKLGTEWGRNMIGDDIWVNAWKARVLKTPECTVVADDLRFPNEVKAVKDLDGISVILTRNAAQWVPDDSHHPSQKFYELDADLAVTAPDLRALRQAINDLLAD